MSGHRQLHAAWRGDTGALVRFPVLTFSHLFSFSFGRCTIVRLTSCDASPHQKFHHPLSSRFCRCSGNPSRRSCSADRRLRCVPRTDTRCRVPQRPRSRRSPTASGSVRGRSWSVFCACVASRCRQYDLRACSSIYPRRRRRELMVARIPGVCGVCAPPRFFLFFFVFRSTSPGSGCRRCTRARSTQPSLPRPATAATCRTSQARTLPPGASTSCCSSRQPLRSTTSCS